MNKSEVEHRKSINKISVLYIANDSSLYGANQSLINLLSSLKYNKLGKNILYHVVIPNSGPIEELLIDHCIPYTIIRYRIDSANWDKSLYSICSFVPKLLLKYRLEIPALRELRKIVEKNEVQIIHSNSSVIGLGYRLAKKKDLKHVWHLREFQDLGLKVRPFLGWNYLYNQIEKSDAIVSITNKIAAHYKVKDKSYIIFNAVANRKLILAPGRKEPYFLFCGSLSPNKGVHEAICAFAKFKIKHPKYSLLIAGSASSHHKSYVSKLKKIVAELNLNESVCFLGFREDASILMNKAQALLMCSRNEGMGRVTPEAMLNNCLVIGYDDAGTSEIINNGVTGFLYKKEDELVKRMVDIVDRKIDVDEISRKAFHFAEENFLEETYGEKIIKVYTSILN